MAIQDKTVTILGATCSVHSIQFTEFPIIVDGVETGKGISATAYGTATRSDGSKDTEAVTWVLSGAAETTVKSFMSGQAVQRLREKMGLES